MPTKMPSRSCPESQRHYADGADGADCRPAVATSSQAAAAQACALLPPTALVDAHADMAPVSMLIDQLRKRPRLGDASDASLGAAFHVPDEANQIFHDLQDSDPAAAQRMTHATGIMPEAGSTFLGFRLLDELGRGAFGRVFLAQQGELADRMVALKVSADLPGESQTLAQLQHTNIVPIYSVHQAPPFHAVCMPYFGPVTLADLLRDLHERQTLPVSGDHIVSTLNHRKSLTQSVLSPAKTPEVAATSGVLPSPISAPTSEPTTTQRAPAAAGHTTEILDRLNHCSYVDAILFLAARLADGLAHAHDRGIFHRDLKPANILLTDDGQPMLLDFNLSQDSKLPQTPSAARVGGTLPYMAPEHLEAFQGEKRHPVDGRSDLYSLGLILFELLTGQHPFAVGHGPIRKLLPVMIAQRRERAPLLRQFNRAISPAVESIVRHCLEPDPARRYQSGHELREDLERQLAHLPLKHAPEPALRERAVKWTRRHPRLASITTVAAAAAVLLALLTAAFVVRGQRLKQFQAVETLNGFENEIKTAQFLLYDRNADTQQLEDGVAQCQAALKRYELLDNPRWHELPAVASLPRPERERLDNNLGEALFVMARATQVQAGALADETSRASRTQFALHLNELAETCYGSERSPRALWEQRADFTRLLGKQQESDDLRRRAEQTPLKGDRDYYLLGHKHALEGNFRKALPLLEQATRQDPQNFAAWFVRGNCHYELLQDAQAIGCFHACIALRPDFPWSWFNRGLAYARLRNYPAAHTDLDRVLELRPDAAKAYVTRAEVAHQLKKYAAAVRDLTSALERGQTHAHLYFLRARSKDALADREGAKSDRAEGMRQEPTDPESWVQRGLVHVQSDPKQALADFEEALKLNPRHFPALQNKAAILVDKFQRDADSLRVMDETVALYPDSVLALGGRGVLLARVGKRAAAHKDAEAALLIDVQPPTLYQVACIYALTAKNNPDDKLKAFQLLAGALRNGFGLQWLDQDTDLDPIRHDPEFERVVRAARALQTVSKK